jgi:mannose-6-phosphate isomerase-like protein (cupin superfamily)
MPIDLSGGCRVSLLREGIPARVGNIRVWPHVGKETGARAISLRVLELAQGRSAPLGGAACDEVLYVIEGAGTLLLDGAAREIGPDTGFSIPPGARFEIDNPGPQPITVISSRCPDPGDAPRPAPRDPGKEAALARLADCRSETTGDRWYRVLLNGIVTQFVGAIPPGRAPDHYHEYEEVLCILEGRGRMWAGASATSVERGSCIYLPRRQVHCVENTGTGELRLLGVFYPAGSPAVRYSG